MNKISINLIGQEDNFDLKITSPASGDKTSETPSATQDKEKVLIQETDVTSELPNAGKRQVTVDADLLEVLVGIAKGQAASKVKDTDLATAIKQLADATSEGNDTADRRFLGARPVEAYVIDKDDIFPDNGFVMFFANSTSFAIYDDKRAGFTIKPPYNRTFKFKTLQRTVDKSSPRNPNYISLSTIIIRSKKEAEWLRSHSLFKIKFFEKKGEVSGVSLDLQDKIVKAWGIVSVMEDHLVMQRCNNEGIEIDTTDINQLRKRLSFKIAENMSKDEQKMRKKPLQDLEDHMTGNLKNSDQQNFAMPSTTY